MSILKIWDLLVVREPVEVPPVDEERSGIGGDKLADTWISVELPENYESTKPIIWDFV